MTESVVLSSVVALASILAHIAVAAYWAGRIVGRLTLIEHRLEGAERRLDAHGARIHKLERAL